MSLKVKELRDILLFTESEFNDFYELLKEHGVLNSHDEKNIKRYTISGKKNGISKNIS